MTTIIPLPSIPDITTPSCHEICDGGAIRILFFVIMCDFDYGTDRLQGLATARTACKALPLLINSTHAVIIRLSFSTLCLNMSESTINCLCVLFISSSHLSRGDQAVTAQATSSTMLISGVSYRLHWSPCGSWRSPAIPSWCPTSSEGNAVRRAKGGGIKWVGGGTSSKAKQMRRRREGTSLAWISQ